jgi:hypothetical protein
MDAAEACTRTKLFAPSLTKNRWVPRTLKSFVSLAFHYRSSMQPLGYLKLPTSFANPLAFLARYGARRYDADRVHPSAAR